MKGLIKRGYKTYKGSFTIEAAFLMTVIIPVLAALVYLAVFLHDRAWIQNAAMEKAARIAVQGYEEKGTGFDGIVGGEKLQKKISSTEKKVNVEVKGNFLIPGIAARFFLGGKLSLEVSINKPILDAKKEIQKYRNFEKLTEGGKE